MLPKVKIQLILTDDWELRGDGSGNMRVIQLDAMRKLREIYEQYELRCSFNVEVMQQLQHLKWGQTYPHLNELAHEWEETVKETYARGHDIQLHLHPQWHNAHYEDNRWHLNKVWSILDYHPTEARQMLLECKQYLEGLIRSLNPDYCCISFRSGAWCIAPSPHILPILSDLGIVFDMSIVGGLFYDLDMVHLDYRKVDQFLPYYPKMHDARHLSDSVESIVCIPTHSFTLIRGPKAKISEKISRSLFPVFWRENFLAPYETPIPNSGSAQNYSQHWSNNEASQEYEQIGVVEKMYRYFTYDKFYKISDLSTLNYMDMRAMLQNIRRQAKASGWSIVPVVLENHTKDVGDYKPIEKFCAHLAKSSDIEVITSSQLAHNIQSGVYPIRMAGNG